MLLVDLVTGFNLAITGPKTFQVMGPLHWISDSTNHHFRVLLQKVLQNILGRHVCNLDDVAIAWIEIIGAVLDVPPHFVFGKKGPRLSRTIFFPRWNLVSTFPLKGSSTQVARLFKAPDSQPLGLCARDLSAMAGYG